ncbi:hypothetical protein [Nocardia flavorosea]|uniref:Uncharacterized protein n=1 Tax=Nocardia flavorosea TaxID=53429 RepID=A0A846YKK3_9NOCA|nr:hypothetical protein [Nocardia flavorosea]NKY57708.1 hypothetical protein [Nocardia flavorosea]
MADLVVRSRLNTADPGGAARLRSEAPVLVTVYPVLDYFSVCPRCGYAAEASTTVRTFADGTADRETHISCGMPCGWQETR